MATKKVEKKAKADPWEKLNELQAQLNRGAIERQQEINGLLVALLAREHMLILGPPGSAKSMLVEFLQTAITGATQFTYLMTRFTAPDEVFGPPSMKGLKEDKYHRVTKGKLPTANLAFLDEVFKANSSILNSLLTLINERYYDNGDTRETCPLETLLGASNELPESDELAALYDRFMVRFWTGYVADKGEQKRMLMEGGQAPTERLTLDELHQMQAEVDQVVVTEAIVDTLLEIKWALEKQGFVASDRRWCKTLRILQASAFLAGREEVENDDLMILCNVLWKEPKDRGALSQVIGHIANPAAAAAREILDAAIEQYRALSIGQDVSETEAGAVFGALVDARERFEKMRDKLGKLTSGKRNGAVEEAVGKIARMEEEVKQYALKISGMG